MSPQPWPKPKVAKRGPKERAPLKRSRMKSRGPRTKKSGGAAFPKVKNPAYRAWIRSLDCLLAGAYTREQLTLADVECAFARAGWAQEYRHVCWGRIECAHVNDTQARGAGDVGECAPLCAASHQALDQRLGAATFAKVTGLNLTHIAAGLAQTYVERGGTPEPR